MRKKYSGKTQNIISAVVWGFLVLSAGLLLFWLGRLKMLPTLYFCAAAALLSVTVGLLGLLLLPPRRSRRRSKTVRSRQIIAWILSVILIAGCMTGVTAASRLYGTLSSITSVEKVYVLYEIYVRADDPAHRIQDTAGYTFALADTTDSEDAGKILSELEDLLGTGISPEGFATSFDMVDALYAGEADAIILNSAYVNILDAMEEYADFADRTRLIHEYVIEKEVSATTPPGTSGLLQSEVGKKPFLLYISGNDARRQFLADGGSDVNILVAVNPAAKQILLVNTPRDYYVVNPASGDGSRDKLSHCGLHGIQNCVSAIEGLYAQPIDYYARINFSGFRTLVDALGGVTVYSDKAFKAGEYYIQEGENFLNGNQALAFARERKNLRGGDNDRGKNQMKLISAMVDQLSASTLLLRYNEILDSLEGMFSTSMPPEVISGLVQQQISDMSSWDVLSFAVTGDNGNDRCWAVGGGFGYVMYPHENMVEHASGLISRVLNGETLAEDDLIVP